MLKRSLIEGEKSIIAVITILCIVVLKESILILYKDPGITKAGFAPVLVSSIMLVMIFFTWREAVVFPQIYSKDDDIKRKIKLTLNRILPKEVTIGMVLLVMYAIALPVFHFYITTFIFLVIGMITFRIDNYLKAVSISIGSLVVISILFSQLFKVVLP